MSNYLDILSDSNSLTHWISKDNKDIDLTLLFRGIKIIEKWVDFIKEIQRIEPWKAPVRMRSSSNSYTAYLMSLRKVGNNYVYLRYMYDSNLKIAMNHIGERELFDFENDRNMSAFLADQDIECFKDVKDVTEYLDNYSGQLQKLHSTACLVIEDTTRIMKRVMDWGYQIILDTFPSDEDIAKAIDAELREWALAYRDMILSGMKEQLNKFYKVHRTDPYTRELWGELLSADEDALRLAAKQQISECDDKKQEHWGKDYKRSMDKNSQLMELFYKSCRTEELFVLESPDNAHSFAGLLTSSNYTLLFYIITRRSLIQCEMFPELKEQYEAWLHNAKEEAIEDKAAVSTTRQSKQDQIIEMLKNGNWKQPATADKIEALMNACLGKDTSSLDNSDVDQCEKMWNLIEGGRGERKDIFVANLAGFFSEENLLAGSPKEISNDLFGSTNNQINNINKGKSKNCSKAFGEVIPFLKKYIDKMIR